VSRRDEDTAVLALRGDQARCLIAAVDAKPAARSVDVGVDGVFGDSEPARDFL
jgi:hypothetical protein